MSKRAHIVILSRNGHQWVGGRQYWINLLEALTRAREQSDAFDVSVLIDRESELPHYEGLKSRLRICATFESLQSPWSLVNRARWRFMRSALGRINPRLEEALELLGATFTYPLRSTKLPSADWIPDFQYVHYPDGSNPDEIAGRKQEFGLSVSQARRVVLSSFTAERDCHKVFPQSVGHTSVLRFRVFLDPQWLTPDPLETVRRYHLPQRFVLVSNLLAPTKNHRLTLQALAVLTSEERVGTHVVFTGDVYDYRNPGFYNGFLAQIHELGLSPNVSVLGLIPKRDQTQLLRASLAYLQPSLFEGWNTGVEEAHMMGKTILLSDIPVQREQCPPRSHFFDPCDPLALANLLRQTFGSDKVNGFNSESERQALQDYASLQNQFAGDFLDLANAQQRTAVFPALLSTVAQRP